MEELKTIRAKHKCRETGFQELDLAEYGIETPEALQETVDFEEMFVESYYMLFKKEKAKKDVGRLNASAKAQLKLIRKMFLQKT